MKINVTHSFEVEIVAETYFFSDLYALCRSDGRYYLVDCHDDSVVCEVFGAEDDDFSLKDYVESCFDGGVL